MLQNTGSTGDKDALAVRDTHSSSTLPNYSGGLLPPYLFWSSWSYNLLILEIQLKSLETQSEESIFVIIVKFRNVLLQNMIYMYSPKLWPYSSSYSLFQPQMPSVSIGSLPCGDFRPTCAQQWTEETKCNMLLHVRKETTDKHSVIELANTFKNTEHRRTVLGTIQKRTLWAAFDYTNSCFRLTSHHS